jgi:hypothetical protein
MKNHKHDVYIQTYWGLKRICLKCRLFQRMVSEVHGSLSDIRQYIDRVISGEIDIDLTDFPLDINYKHELASPKQVRLKKENIKQLLSEFEISKSGIYTCKENCFKYAQYVKAAQIFRFSSRREVQIFQAHCKNCFASGHDAKSSFQASKSFFLSHGIKGCKRDKKKKNKKSRYKDEPINVLVVDPLDF